MSFPLRQVDLTDDETYLLDKLRSRGFTTDADALEAALKNISDANGRKYLLSKVLNSNDALASLGSTKSFNKVKDFWNVSNQENYTPPDISKAKEEGFFDENSPYHWQKRSTSELKQIAKDKGYESLGGMMKDVQVEQTKRNREEPFKGVKGTALELLYPRATEAIKRGETPDVNDWMGDGIEQFLYALNPIGKGLAGEWRASELGSKISGKVVPRFIQNAANPAALEILDATMYQDRDIPRAQMKVGDMLFGTGVNYGMGRMASKFATDNIKNKYAKLLADDAVDFASNKAGDALSENPRNAKLIIRRSAAGTPFTPLVSPVVDWYFDSDEEKARRGELDKMLEDEYKKRKALELLGNQEN